MTEPYLGEIAIFSFSFAPQGWAQCNGQLLQINQNSALFAILGTTYGGNGTSTFGLPNLQGRVPVHVGSSYTLGQAGGEAGHALTALEMPSHTHVPIASGAAADRSTPNGNAWAVNANYPAYSSQPDESMSPEGVAQAGANQPHPNMSPYLTLNFCIALAGIFPPRE
jgi:microcystin-dependent protein